MGKGANVSAITLSWHFPARLFHHHHHRNISKTQLNLIQLCCPLRKLQQTYL